MQSVNDIKQNYQRYRWFFTSSNKLVVGGKSADQNDSLLKTLKNSTRDHIVMHTKDPGSPFSVILADIKEVDVEDLDECAIFTACFSKAWKSSKNKATIDIFRVSQLKKDHSMRTGTWQVLGNIKSKTVLLELSVIKQKGIIRAVPHSVAADKKVLFKIKPGNIDKTNIIAKLSVELAEQVHQNELLGALPAGGISILH